MSNKPHERVSVLTYSTACDLLERHGVQVGHRILAIDGNPVNFDGFTSAIRIMPRPVVLTFQAVAKKPTGPMHVMKKKGPEPLSARENAMRREAALKAAESRGQAWDKKLGNTRKEKTRQAQENDKLTRPFGHDAAMSAESKRVYEAARAKETAEMNQLG